MTSADKDKLIDQLISNCKPVTPPNPFRLFAIWLLTAVLTILATQFLLGMRQDVATIMKDCGYCGSILALGLGASLSAWIAIKISIPGEQPSQFFQWLIPSIPFVLAIGVIVAWFAHGQNTNFWSGIDDGMMCSVVDLVVAIVPLIVLTVITAGLAPLRPFITSVFVALSSLFTAAIAMQLHCACNIACHMAFWHYLPIFFGSLLIAAPMQILLGRWKRKSCG